MNKNKEQEQSFESSLASLERIVANLESGDLSLERALELFEEGVALARRCQSQLGDAERKVEMLLRERGEIKVAPFEPSKDAPADAAETREALSAANVASINQQIRSGESPRDESRGDDSVVQYRER
jgi:exodeoxyribonuclease VII small subunit